MNLNEECLLRYLQYPDELSYTTEFLKLNNKIMEQRFISKNIWTNVCGINFAEKIGMEVC